MRRDLVERAMAGDLEAFTELARLSIDRLYVVARLILRDSDQAEDATQEGLVAAWRDIAGLRDPDRFEPWLRRLVVHACYHEARKDRRRMHYEGQVKPLDEGARDPASALADRDEIERGFRRLDPSSEPSSSCTTTSGCRWPRPRSPWACRWAPSSPDSIAPRSRCAPRSKPTRACRSPKDDRREPVLRLRQPTLGLAR